MSDEDKFELVLHAGNAESSAMMAIESAREGRVDEAESLLEEASAELQTAHRLQTSMLSKAASGESVAVDILLVHAQDHLSMASVLMTVAGESIESAKALQALELRIASLEQASRNQE